MEAHYAPAGAAAAPLPLQPAQLHVQQQQEQQMLHVAQAQQQAALVAEQQQQQHMLHATQAHQQQALQAVQQMHVAQAAQQQRMDAHFLAAAASQAMLPAAGGAALVATSLPPLAPDGFAGAAELQAPLQALKEEAAFAAAPPPALLAQPAAAPAAVDAHLQDPGEAAGALRPPPPHADAQFSGVPSPLLPPSVEQVCGRPHGPLRLFVWHARARAPSLHACAGVQGRGAMKPSPLTAGPGGRDDGQLARAAPSASPHRVSAAGARGDRAHARRRRVCSASGAHASKHALAGPAIRAQARPVACLCEARSMRRLLRHGAGHGSPGPGKRRHAANAP